MRVFVTGGTGFIGTHVVAALRARGHEPVCLVRHPAKAAAAFAAPAPALVQGDLADVGALARGCDGAAAVVHLAGLTAARSRAELFAVNADGTRAVVDVVRASRGAIGRVIHVSSLAAAGPAPFGVPLTGAEPPHPVSDYGRSKLAGEGHVRELHVPWVIMRPPAVYGPHDREFLRLFRLAARGVAPLFGGGTQRLSLVYGPDLADAIVACLEHLPPHSPVGPDGRPVVSRDYTQSPVGPGGRPDVARDYKPGVYYPAHPETTTARALVEGIGAALQVRTRILPLPRALVRPLFFVTGTAAKLARRATLLSSDKANEILADAWTCAPTDLERTVGWRAATDLSTGLRATADWYRAAGWL